MNVSLCSTEPERISLRRICILLKIEYVTFLACSSSLSSKISQILCWELVSKRGGSWILHYVKSAYAVTDVPDQVRISLYI